MYKKIKSEHLYKEFTAINDKLILKDGCVAGNDKIHNIDLKFAIFYMYQNYKEDFIYYVNSSN